MDPLDLEGYYVDEKHGRCLRKITRIQPNEYYIQGTYGDDEGDVNVGKEWYVKFQVEHEKILTVDFSTKETSHELILCALWCCSKRIIRWEDGNTWFKLYAPPPNRPHA